MTPAQRAALAMARAAPQGAAHDCAAAHDELQVALFALVIKLDDSGQDFSELTTARFLVTQRDPVPGQWPVASEPAEA